MKRVVGLGALALQVMGMVFVGLMVQSAMTWKGSENFGKLGSLFYGLPISLVSFLLGILVFAMSSAFAHRIGSIIRVAAFAIPLITSALAFVGGQS